MTGTGFMKCIPITCAGRPVRDAISVIEMELVFVARIASAPAIRSSDSKMPNLTAGFSLAASTTSEAGAAASSDVAVVMRPRIASGASAESVPFFICRSRFARMVARALSRAAAALSTSATCHSCCASTCAIPLPIVPAPITAACFMPEGPFVSTAPWRGTRAQWRSSL